MKFEFDEYKAISLIRRLLYMGLREGIKNYGVQIEAEEFLKELKVDMSRYEDMKSILWSVNQDPETNHKYDPTK
jgi:hypothetical protein